jgi:hypothetical protein
METIKTSITIPNDRHLVMDLHIPPSIPPGIADIVLVIQSHQQEKPPRRRVLGAFKGKIRVADDFDAPLGDEFWLGADHEMSS